MSDTLGAVLHLMGSSTCTSSFTMLELCVVLGPCGLDLTFEIRRLLFSRVGMLDCGLSLRSSSVMISINLLLARALCLTLARVGVSLCVPFMLSLSL